MKNFVSSADELFMFDHFVGLALKGLKTQEQRYVLLSALNIFQKFIENFYY